jgi:predicted alpha/beta-fold hydrolase
MNRPYMERFLRLLRAKIREKHARFPGRIDLAGLRGVRDFRGFDDRYTAPLHGFRDADDYWARSSSRPFLPRITIPSLLVNAANDPFLGPGCFPREEALAIELFHLEVPDDGGHCGFSSGGRESWAEQRAAEFLEGGN